MNIEKKVLEKIVPTVGEKKAISAAVENLCAQMQEKATAYGHTVDIMLVGSIAKGTYLSGALDIDLFILYPIHVPREEIKEFTLKLVKGVLTNWTIQYAEHPYIRGKYEQYDVDVVPCYNVQDAGQMQCAVDRTPFHTKFVQQNLAPEQRNQVRLLKQFLKGIGCYSAEVKVQGFSGYLAELLVLKYGSFRDTLTAALSWTEKETIVLEGSTGVETTDKPFTVIDPVDPARNVAAALSDDKRRLFLQAAREYLRKPQITFFFPRPIKPWPLNKITPHLKNIIGIELLHPDIIDDIVYSQVRKGQTKLAGLFRNHNFDVIDTSFYVNDHILLIVHLNALRKPPTKIHRGPPIEKKEYVDAFLKKWRNHDRLVDEPFIKDQRWWVEIEQQYQSAQELLEYKMADVALGKHLDKLKDNAIILVGKQLAQPHYTVFWTEYLSNIPSWEQ